MNYEPTTDRSIYETLRLSFPDLTESMYMKIIRSPKFLTWELGFDTVSKGITCCAAIFDDTRHLPQKRYTLALFCIHPKYRGQSLGRTFFEYIKNKYQRLRWTANVNSVGFYEKLGYKHHSMYVDRTKTLYSFFI